MRHGYSMSVAFIGVAVPMALGYFYFVFTNHSVAEALLVGGTLTATSVGITMRVMSELGKTNSEEGKIILENSPINTDDNGNPNEKLDYDCPECNKKL